MKKDSKLKIVAQHLKYDQVSLIEPSNHFYLHVAIEVDTPWTPLFLAESKGKKAVIKKCKRYCNDLLNRGGILEANVFKALLVPPGKSQFLAENPERVKMAKYDIVLLIEVRSAQALEDIQKEESYMELIGFITENSIRVHQTVNSNARRINDVDHTRQGVFLFNYFYADDVQQNLEVWNYTAGWFERESNLDNSTLFRPVEEKSSDYAVINHCRWDGLSDILPALIFKKSFRTYVLDNFYANNVGAMPILYRLVL